MDLVINNREKPTEYIWKVITPSKSMVDDAWNRAVEEMDKKFDATMDSILNTSE